MSGVRAAGQATVADAETEQGKSSTVVGDELEVSDMVDVLYDIVATGIEPLSGVSCAEIETFLHQHARQPRSVEAFREFFETHGIEARVKTEPRVPLRVLEPVPNMEAPVSPVTDVSLEPSVRTLEVAEPQRSNGATPPAVSPQAADGQTPVPTLNRANTTVPADVTGPVSAMAVVPRRWVSGLVLGAAAVLLLVVSAGYLAVQSLRQDLEQSRALTERANQAVIDQRAREAALAESLRHNRELIEHLEQQNGVLLDNLLPSPVVRTGPR